MARIVETDNHARDYPGEMWASPYRLPEKEAKEIAAIYNRLWCADDWGRRHWKVVDDDYTLAPGFEP